MHVALTGDTSEKLWFSDGPHYITDITNSITLLLTSKIKYIAIYVTHIKPNRTEHTCLSFMIESHVQLISFRKVASEVHYFCPRLHGNANTSQTKVIRPSILWLLCKWYKRAFRSSRNKVTVRYLGCSIGRPH